jgi:hypothetical protein
MGAMAAVAARWRTPVRLNLPELDALLSVAGEHRGSRELNGAVRRLERARDRRRRAVRAAGA